MRTFVIEYSNGHQYAVQAKNSYWATKEGINYCKTHKVTIVSVTQL